MGGWVDGWMGGWVDGCFNFPFFYTQEILQKGIFGLVNVSLFPYKKFCKREFLDL
jgi:hypothetical protein